MTETTTMTTTIKLTGRRPIKINPDEWECVALASYKNHNGEVLCQANRSWYADVKVRRHSDGRVIVHGCARYRTQWQHERNQDGWAGTMLPVGHTEADLMSAIRNACSQLTLTDGIPDLSDEVIADLDPEEV